MRGQWLSASTRTPIHRTTRGSTPRRDLTRPRFRSPNRPRRTACMARRAAASRHWTKLLQPKPATVRRRLGYTAPRYSRSSAATPPLLTHISKYVRMSARSSSRADAPRLSRPRTPQQRACMHRLCIIGLQPSVTTEGTTSPRDCQGASKPRQVPSHPRGCRRAACFDDPPRAPRGLRNVYAKTDRPTTTA